MDYPATRKEAKANGWTHYYTGKPCKHGHIALRLTKGTCVECRRIEWVEQNARRAELPKSEASKAAGRRYYERNKALVKAKASVADIEKRRKYKSKWKKENKEHTRLSTNIRRRRLREATPPWITEKQKAEMKAKYEEAAQFTTLTHSKFVVDHIVPLKGRNVCGLHVPWNLQVIHHLENSRKHNKL